MRRRIRIITGDTSERQPFTRNQSLGLSLPRKSAVRLTYTTLQQQQHVNNVLNLKQGRHCSHISGLIECLLLLVSWHMSPVKRICVFEHSFMTNFNCACSAIQRGQGSGFLSEGSSWLTACTSEQRRFWRDCADAQARLNLRCSHRRYVPNSLDAVHILIYFKGCSTLQDCAGALRCGFGSSPHCVDGTCQCLRDNN